MCDQEVPYIAVPIKRNMDHKDPPRDATCSQTKSPDSDFAIPDDILSDILLHDETSILDVCQNDDQFVPQVEDALPEQFSIESTPKVPQVSSLNSSQENIPSGFHSPGFSDDVFTGGNHYINDKPRTAPACLSSSGYPQPWDGVVPNCSTEKPLPLTSPSSFYPSAAEELRHLAFSNSKSSCQQEFVQRENHTQKQNFHSNVNNQQHQPQVGIRDVDLQDSMERPRSLRWRSYSADCRSAESCDSLYSHQNACNFRKHTPTESYVKDQLETEPPRLSHFPIPRDSWQSNSYQSDPHQSYLVPNKTIQQSPSYHANSQSRLQTVPEVPHFTVPEPSYQKDNRNVRENRFPNAPMSKANSSVDVRPCADNAPMSPPYPSNRDAYLAKRNSYSGGSPSILSHAHLSPHEPLWRRNSAPHVQRAMHEAFQQRRPPMTVKKTNMAFVLSQNLLLIFELHIHGEDDERKPYPTSSSVKSEYFDPHFPAHIGNVNPSTNNVNRDHFLANNDPYKFFPNSSNKLNNLNGDNRNPAESNLSPTISLRGDSVKHHGEISPQVGLRDRPMSCLDGVTNKPPITKEEVSRLVAPPVSHVPPNFMDKVKMECPPPQHPITNPMPSPVSIPSVFNQSPSRPHSTYSANIPRCPRMFSGHEYHGEFKEPAGSYQRRGSLQLWQFLVTLLNDSSNQQFITWTGRGLEFKLIEPEEVARRWGIQKNRPAMNYDKLSRSLRYYYEKGIMQKVAGERYVYKFVCEAEALLSLSGALPHPPMQSPLNYSDHIDRNNSFIAHRPQAFDQNLYCQLKQCSHTKSYNRAPGRPKLNRAQKSKDKAKAETSDSKMTRKLGPTENPETS